MWILLLLAPHRADAVTGHGGGENEAFAAVGARSGASLFSGAATVSIPILIPPGRATTTPDLALAYSSHGGLSEFGLGWSLTLGAVHRSTRHGSPRCSGAHVDDFRVVLSDSANDLVRVSGDFFALKTDEAYTEAFADPVTNIWTLRTRDGLVYRFGESPEARVHTGSDEFFDDGPTCEFTTAWHLTSVEDPNGNQIHIAYQQSGNRPLPMSIAYGGNAEASIPHPFRIRFETEPIAAERPRLRTFGTGVEQILGERVTAVSVEARASAVAPFEEVRRYEIGHEALDGAAGFLLTSVATTGLPVRRFGYSTSTPTLVDSVTGTIPTEPIYLSRQFPTGPIIAIRDMNGDALMDRVRVVGTTYRVSYGERGTDRAFTAQEYEWEIPASIGLAPIDRIGAENYGQDIYLVEDLTGDGKPDFIVRDPSQASIRVFRGRCMANAYDCGFDPNVEVWNNPGNLSLRHAEAWGGSADGAGGGRRVFRDLLDMNGDGRLDIVRARSSGLDVYFNHGRGFESNPARFETGDDYLAYVSNPDTYTIGSEVQMIDVNGDNLPDRLEGAAFRDWVDPTSPPNAPLRFRVPETYYAVDLDGSVHGPYDLDDGPYLCRTAPGSAAWTLCSTGSGYALPGGWALVPAMSVRLHTASGFTERIHSPAPFFTGALGSAPRLRASVVDQTSQRSFPYRDFVDMNGDGRLDWVASGAPDGSLTTEWYILFNQGDGRFASRALVRYSGASLATPGAPIRDLGDVRSSDTLDAGWHWLGETFHHSSSSPDGLSEAYAHTFDLDADGIPELVTSVGMTNDRWNVREIRYEDQDTPHTKPNLLVRVQDGLGGHTEFRYRPSSDFVEQGALEARLPFSSWVVSGIRRRDGLCDETPVDWFRLDRNPCLAAGFETVERIEYADGLFDESTREFRGFGLVKVTDGPAEHASERRVRFYQDEHRKGRLQSEEIYLGGVDLHSRTTYDWRSVASGVRTQIHLQEQRIEEFVLYEEAGPGEGADRCVVHRSSIRDPSGEPDHKTRVREACSMPCEGAGTSDALCSSAPIDAKIVTTAYDDPVPSASQPVWDRPVRIASSYVDENGTQRLSSFTIFAYDGLSYGTDRGNVSIERHLVDPIEGRWTEKRIGHDNDLGPGVGNIVSVDLIVSGHDREPVSTTFDPDFALHPVSQRLPATTRSDGEVIRQETESRFDLRYGTEIERVGVHGRAAGDVAGALHDSLGRPICEFEPGTHCEGGPGFESTTEYVYHPGNPNAADPIERMHSVEVRRREPGAPGGYLVTRTYRDGLGRERLTTQQQFIVDGSGASTPPEMRTVVRRHLDYGAHGHVSRRFAPYLPDPSGLDLSPPFGTSTIEIDYALNGNGGGDGSWDPARRPWRIVQHDGGVHRKHHYGRVTRSIDALGHHVVEESDAHGRVVRREVFDGATNLLTSESARYDGRDAAIAEWVGDDPTTRIERAYDLLGRLVSTDDPDSGLWSARYDEAGNVIFENDPAPGQSVQSCFDALDRLVLQCGRATDDYDPGLCDAAQPVCTTEYRFGYDETHPVASSPNHGIGRLTRVEGPSHHRQHAYDVRGRIVRQVDVIAGIEATTAFDFASGIDRLVSMTYPDGEVVRYGYDPGGQTQWLAAQSAHRPWGTYYVSNVHYDLRGRVASLMRGNGTVDRYTYHGAEENHRVDEIRVQTDPSAGALLEIDHLRVRYDDYDPNGRLVSIEDALVASGPLSLSADYAFDGAGRLQSVGGPNPESFAYDGIGNIVSINGKVFSNDSAPTAPRRPHQFTRFGDVASTHWVQGFDANGQRTGKARSDGSVTHAYGYDSFGRMRSLTVDGVTKRFEYDAAGARISETRAGLTRRFFGSHAEATEGLLHKYYYVGETLIATRTDPAPQLSEPGTTAANPSYLPPRAYWAVMSVALTLLAFPIGRYRRTLGLAISGSGALGGAMLVLSLMLPLVVGVGCAGDESVRHYHMSQRSSPLLVTKARGALDRQYRYSAYGEVRRYDAAGQPAGIDPASRREFTGYETDPESELQFAGARYYDPSQAQFLSLDPKQENASPYAYAAWDPVDFTDPTGEDAFTLAFLVFLALALAAVVVQAIITGVQTSSWSNGLTALGIGVGTIVAGTIAGMVLPGSLALLPGITQQAVQGALLATGIGTSAYGVATASDTSSIVGAGIGLALSLSGAAFALSSASASAPVGGTSPATGSASARTASAGTPPGTRVASGGANRLTFAEQMLKILRGSAEGRIVREVRTQNEFEIAALRGEANTKGTVRGRPVGDNNVSAFEVLSFTVDSAGNRSFNESIVTVEFTAPSEPLPDAPSLIGAGNPPFVRTIIHGPHPIACGACPRVFLP